MMIGSQSNENVYWERIQFPGTGTFGRVVIAQSDEKKGDRYCAIKILSIIDVIKKKQTEHVKSEKNILLQITHPFVISM